jgi:hypothetical protein
MAIPLISPFNPSAVTAGSLFQTLTSAAAATSTTATNGTTAASGTNASAFAVALGQIFSQLGPLAFASSALAGNPTATTNTGATSGFGTQSLFDQFLLSSQGLGQFSSQNLVQQLLLTNLTVSGNDPSGVNGNTTTSITDTILSLAAQGNLSAQTNQSATQPNAIAFSTSALAQAFQIGNDSSSPA